LFEADFYLADPEVSKRHAYVQIVGGRVLCVDIGSRNGLTRKGKAVGWAWLDRDLPLGIGPFEVRLPAENREVTRFEEGGKRPHSPLSGVANRADLPEVTLEILYPGNRLSYWPMRSELALVGRATECKVQLVDKNVSRFHCSLVRTPQGLWVIDLLGEKGIVVNGSRVRYARLDVDHELIVGGFRIRPVAVNPAAQTSSSNLSIAIPSKAFPAIPLAGRSASGEPVALPWKSLTDLAISMPSNQELLQKNLFEAPSFTDLLRQSASPGGPSSDQAQMLEALLAPLANQFANAQQQLIGQLNLVIETVFQMVGTVQRDQMELVNQELRQIRELSTELQTLQVQSANALNSNGSKPASLAGQGDAPMAIETQDAGNPRSLSGRVESRPSSQGLQGSDPSIAVPPPAAATTQMPQGSPAQSSDMHAVICQRIAELDRERQSRWQKILNLLNGNLRGGSKPEQPNK
jgi:pSer/pThr/pTyr-binding forkhead associated (FHA) protein